MCCKMLSQSISACVGHSCGARRMLSNMAGRALPLRASAAMAASLRTSRSLRGLQCLRSMRPSTQAIRPDSMRACSAAGSCRRASTALRLWCTASKCAVSVSLPCARGGCPAAGNTWPGHRRPDKLAAAPWFAATALGRASQWPCPRFAPGRHRGRLPTSHAARAPLVLVGQLVAERQAHPAPAGQGVVGPAQGLLPAAINLCDGGLLHRQRHSGQQALLHHQTVFGTGSGILGINAPRPLALGGLCQAVGHRHLPRHFPRRLGGHLHRLRFQRAHRVAWGCSLTCMDWAVLLRTVSMARN